MVDMVDYAESMTTEVLEREPPATRGTRNTVKMVGDLDPRMWGVIKVVFQNLGHAASRQKLQKAAQQHGYSRAEFAAAMRSLEQTTFDLANDDLPVKAPEKPALPDRKSSARGFDPVEAGKRAVEEMRQAEGGAWTGAELEGRFGLSSATLHRRRKEHRIVYWRDAKHDFHYPKWQFTAPGALLPGVQEVLQLFRSEDEWRVMSYFLGKRQQLGDRRPLDLLRAGEKEAVLAHAKLHAEENTW
jgi:hypothetical protein